MVAVAKVGKDIGFYVRVLQVASPVERTLVAQDGLWVVAEVMVGVADAVPRVGLPAAAANLLLDGKSLLAIGECLPIIAELGVQPADSIERASLPAAVAYSLVQVKCLQGVSERRPVSALALKDPHEVEMTERPADVIA